MSSAVSYILLYYVPTIMSDLFFLKIFLFLVTSNESEEQNKMSVKVLGMLQQIPPALEGTSLL